jgi:hypothetical protein
MFGMSVIFFKLWHFLYPLKYSHHTFPTLPLQDADNQKFIYFYQCNDRILSSLVDFINYRKK